MPDLLKIIKPILLVFQYFSFFCLLSFIINGCSSSTEYIPEKMDTPLKQKIRQLEKDAPETVIGFAGKTNQSINEDMITQLKSTGITMGSIINDIFTASGNVDNIKKVSRLDFIVFLEIAKELDIK